MYMVSKHKDFEDIANQLAVEKSFLLVPYLHISKDNLQEPEVHW